MQIYVNVRTTIMFITSMVLLNLTLWFRLPLANNMIGSLVWLYLELSLYALLLNTVMNRRYMKWNVRFRRIHKRIARGQAESVIAELSIQHDVGDHDLITTLMLSNAYAYLGRGEPAYSLVQEVLQQVTDDTLCDSNSLSLRLQCEILQLAHYDALIALGHYSEAAFNLLDRVNRALQPNYMTALAAWGFFLAEDYYNTQIVLEQVKAPAQFWQKHVTYIHPQYHLMTAYMKYRLLGEDTSGTLYNLKQQFPKWEQEVALNAHNPYGVRLRPILDDLRPLLQNGVSNLIG